MDDFRQVYESPESQWVSNNAELVVQLASPWRRIGAVLLNYIIYMLIFVPVFVAMGPYIFQILNGADQSAVAASMHEAGPDSLVMAFMVTGVGFLVFIVLQLVWMIKRGQSIGKRIMGIKVVTMDGTNPGFVGYVVLREAVFWFILTIISMIPFIGIVAYYGIQVALLVMIFMEKNNRQTLQDLLAKTLVVKA